MKRSAKNFVGSLPIIFQIAMQSRGWSRWETHNLSTQNHLLRQKDEVGFGTSEKEEELLENETRQKTCVPAKFIKGERGQAEPCLSRRRGTFLLVRESWEKGDDNLEVVFQQFWFCDENISFSPRFLCGTCNISFKLDRRKGLKVDGKKKELASRTISVATKKGL